jgi:hypothetical protein
MGVRSRGAYVGIVKMADEALSVLNWMVGRADTDGAVPDSEMHDWVRARCMSLATEAREDLEPLRRDEAPDAPRGDDEALSALLRGRGSYDATGGVSNHLAAFRPNLVSLPKEAIDSPLLEELLTPDDSRFLSAPERMLRSDIEDINSITENYVDLVLRTSRDDRDRFVMHLPSIELFRVTRNRKGTVGIFFVHQSLANYG